MEDNLIKRIMPHSIEAEQSVIGAMLIDPNAIPTAAGILVPEDFYQKACGILFQAITALDAEGKSADPVTLQNRLREMGAPDEISSLSYLSDLINAVPTSINVRQYAKIVADKSRLRKMIRTMEELTNKCYADQQSIDEITGETETKIFNLLQNQGGDEIVPIRRTVLEALEQIEKASRSDSSVTGLATGFTDLDAKTSGFQKSDLILVAARPSMGKTAFVLNIADYMALHDNVTVAIFSLEMSRGQLVNRLLSQESRVESEKLRNGNLTDSDWSSLIESAGVVGNSHILIDDTPGITVGLLRSKCRRMKQQYGLDIVLIDYLQLMNGSGRNSDSRQQEISEISRSLKALARELQVPVVALSQLSRAVEQRPDHRPVLSDLRESGAIEQDADIVMFLYRDDYYHKDTDKKNIAEVIIAKQRNGPIGTVELVWMPQYTKFANLKH